MYTGLALTTALTGILLSITAVKMSKRLFVYGGAIRTLQVLYSFREKYGCGV
jgi:hypothetical protein